MSRSRNAEADAFVEALGMALLFLWMNGWKAVFAGRLRQQLEGRRRRRGRGGARGACAWCNPPSSAEAGPVAMAVVAILPAASACAFFRNVTALADGGSGRGKC